MTEPVYADDTLDAVIAAAGGLPESDIEIGSPTGWGGGRMFLRQSRGDALRERLEGAAERYALAMRIAARPSQASMAADYGAVERKLYKALRAVLPPDRAARGRLHAALGLGLPDGDIRPKIGALLQLHRAARSAHSRKEVKPKKAREERNEGDQALNELMIDLIEIYADVFERRPGTSAGSPESAREGEPGGPMIRFIRAALRPLLSPMPSDKALRSRIERVRGSTSEQS
jgi:hypothetical protein